MNAITTLSEVFAQYAPTLTTKYSEEDDTHYCELKNNIVGSGKYFATARIDAFFTLKKQGVIPENIIITQQTN